MSLKQNKDKTPEEKEEELQQAAKQLGFEIEPFFEDKEEPVKSEKDEVK